MKGSHWFIIFIFAFLLLMFAVEYQLPKKFVWTPTFDHLDHQPLGCAVFDSVLASSLPSGYSLSRKTFYELEAEDTIHQRGVMLVARELDLSDIDVHAILRMAERGNKIMLVSSSFGEILEDTLQFECTSAYLSLKTLKNTALSFRKDSLFWVGDSTVYPRQKFRFYPQFCEQNFRNCDSLPTRRLVEKDLIEEMEGASTDQTVISYNDYHPLVAFGRPWGKGEIILVSTPLLFTNYGILDGHNATFLFRLLSQMKELPIVRTEGYSKATAQIVESPFRYFLSQPPLRWALYLTMTTILLFMLFTAKRKQRAIPIVRDPENKSLEFVGLIGTLYYQKKDHADLVRKKFTYFAEELRRQIQVDIEETTDDERTSRRIALKTGMNADDIRRLILELRPILREELNIDEVEMKRIIDQMNNIINHI